MSRLQGIVVHRNVLSVPHPTNGSLVRNQIRVVMRQAGRGTPLAEAVLDTGAGNDGLQRATYIAQRLRPGTEATAIGTAIRIKQDGTPGAQATMLSLRGCTQILGGEQPARHEPAAGAEAAA